MKFLLIIVLLLLPLTIKADQDRFNSIFTSKNGKYELRLNNIENLEWVLVEKSTKKILYRFKDKLLWSMSAIVSDDGKFIVAVDDYSQQNEKNNPKVLLFYRSGKIIKSYKLSNLLDNSKIITVSASHFRWLNFYESSKKAFLIENSTISLQTFELNNYTFDINTGTLLKKERDKILDEETIYVFGRVSGKDEEENEIEVFCSIYGNVQKGTKIKFVSKKFKLQSDNLITTLIIKNGELVEIKGINLNGCR